MPKRQKTPCCSMGFPYRSYTRGFGAKSAKIHLTDIVVLRLKEPATYFDDTLPNFGVRVGKQLKTWIVVRGAERRRTRIGTYPDTSLADARNRRWAVPSRK